ncbi:hypothetical protein ACTZWT_18175 [Rhodopseudomonas sp. NSM]|uniref:hypothetical protein n=1 Tax=Rhodopseudomonas sp. NSM TaxID=3457630 RepID=UPI00403755D3
MAPRRDQSRQVTSELIAFHARRGRALQRAAIYAAMRALVCWLRAALGRRRF